LVIVVQLFHVVILVVFAQVAPPLRAGRAGGTLHGSAASSAAAWAAGARGTGDPGAETRRAADRRPPTRGFNPTQPARAAFSTSPPTIVLAIEADGRLAANPPAGAVIPHGAELILIGTTAAERRFMQEFIARRSR